MVSSEDNLGIKMLTDEVTLRCEISDLMGSQRPEERFHHVNKIKGLTRLIAHYAAQYEMQMRKPLGKAVMIGRARAG